MSTARMHAAEGAEVRRTRSVRRSTREEGFSLIELLVVCLVIGILCAIAIPQFLSQTSKAKDASAKELARTAETTAESIATDNDGSYESVTPKELHSVEVAIPIAEGNGAWISATTHTRTEYSVTATATDGIELTIARNSNGVITRSCHSPKVKTGCSAGENGTW